jgi:pyridoxine 5-phosphate synthase
VHLREDRRHIQDRDLRILREVVPVELNLEMAATKEMIGIASKIRPDMVTLVPEKRQELTTEGGLDVGSQKKTVTEAIKRLKGLGMSVSLFINPDPDDINLCGELGADMVEIHTGMYANAKGKKAEKEVARLVNSVKCAVDLGVLVNAGHGLNYFNVQQIASIHSIRGLYIGHSIISRAVFLGIERAVQEMKHLIKLSEEIK